MGTKNFPFHFPSLTTERNFITGSFIANTGIVDWDTDGKPNLYADTSTDPKDPYYQERYIRCRALAHKLRDDPRTSLKGLDPAIPAQLAEITRREEIIVTAINGEMNKPENFGPYNMAIGKLIYDNSPAAFNAAPLQDIRVQNTRQAAHLSKLASGEGVCRHKSPPAASLYYEAGMKALCVVGFSNGFIVKPDNTFVAHDKKGINNQHMFVMSLQTGNIIEPSHDGLHNIYFRPINFSSTEQFLAGRTAIVASPEGYMIAYSTGATGTKEQEAIINARLEKIKQGSYSAMPRYDYRNPASKAPNDVQLQTYIDAIGAYSLRLAKNQYQQKIMPAVQNFHDAVLKGDAEAVLRCPPMVLQSRHYASALMQAVESNNAALAEAICHHGRQSMGNTLITLIRDHRSIPAMEYAIDKGALSIIALAGIKPANLPMLVTPDEHLRIDTTFTKALVKKLGLSSVDVLNTAIQTGSAAHVKFALEELDIHSLNAKHFTALTQMSQQHKALGKFDIADLLDEFIRKNISPAAHEPHITPTIKLFRLEDFINDITRLNNELLSTDAGRGTLGTLPSPTTQPAKTAGPEKVPLRTPVSSR